MLRLAAAVCPAQGGKDHAHQPGQAVKAQPGHDIDDSERQPAAHVAPCLAAGEGGADERARGHRALPTGKGGELFIRGGAEPAGKRKERLAVDEPDRHGIRSDAAALSR